VTFGTPLYIPSLLGKKKLPSHHLLKGLSHKKYQGSKVVSIDRSSFKLLPQNISPLLIQPPSCFFT